jgi:iron-sulfur cluster repair protein YtfE (RIC family)
MFSEFEKSRKKPAAKRELAMRICQALTIHAQIEEQIFYPAVRQSNRNLADLLNEAEVEHASAKELIAQIEAGDSDEEMLAAKVKVLGEYVKHHIREEQNELFPDIKSSKIDLAELGADLQARKEELERAGVRRPSVRH